MKIKKIVTVLIMTLVITSIFSTFPNVSANIEELIEQTNTEDILYATWGPSEDTIAQSFQLSQDAEIMEAEIYLEEIDQDAAGIIGIHTSRTINTDSWSVKDPLYLHPDDWGWQCGAFSDPFIASAGTTYYLLYKQISECSDVMGDWGGNPYSDGFFSYSQANSNFIDDTSSDIGFKIRGNYISNSPPDFPYDELPLDEMSNVNIDESNGNSVTIECTISDPNGDSMQVAFWQDSGTDIQLCNWMNEADGTTLSYTWAGLSYDTTYYWHCTVIDSSGSNTQVDSENNPNGGLWSFTTETDPQGDITNPEVTTNDATEIDYDSAKLHGTIVYDGGETCQFKFKYREGTSGDWTDVSGWHGSKNTGDTFSETLGGLEENTLYQFKAGARNSGYTDWDENHIKSFTTDSEPLELEADAGGPYEGYNDVEIDFQGFASGGTGDYNWHWNFGDGETSTEKNPTHEYEEIDEYDVTLTVTDSDGDQDSDTTQVIIEDKLSTIPEWAIILLDAAGLLDDIENYWYGDHFEVTIPFNPIDITKLGNLTGSTEDGVDFPDGNGDEPGGNEFDGDYEFDMNLDADIVINIYPGDIGRSSITLEDGDCEIDLSAHAEYKDIGMDFGAGLDADFEYDEEWQWDLMAYLNGEVTFPTVRVQGSIWIIPVYAKVDLKFGAGVEFYFGSPTEWDDSEDIFSNVYDHTEGNFLIGAMCYVGVGVADVIGAGVYTDVGGSWNFRAPEEDGSLFDYFEAYLKFGGYGELIGFDTGYWEWYSTSWNSNDTFNDPVEGWNFMKRDYDSPDWNDEYEDDGILINDAFPASHPSIDRNSNGEKMLVWVEDDKANEGGVNHGEGVNLYFSKYNGFWNGKHRIKNDNMGQSNPSVQLLDDGSAICVYNYAPEWNGEDVEDMFKKTGIAYSIYDGNSWIEEGIIINHETSIGMHLIPVVRSYGNNKAVVAWIYDEDTDIFTVNDRKLYTSFWDGNSWSNPRDILENAQFKHIISAPIDLAVKDDGTTVAVYVVDIDGTLITRFDQPVWYTMFSPPDTFGPDVTNPVYDVGKNAYPSVEFIGSNDYPSFMWTHEDEGGWNEGENILPTATVYYQPNTNTFADPETVASGLNSTSSAFLTGSESTAFGEIPIVGWTEDNSICYKRRFNNGWEDKNILYTHSESVTQTAWDFEAVGDAVSVVFVGKENIADSTDCKLISISADALLTPQIETGIDGPSELFIDDDGEFSVTATDPSPDGELMYKFDWGDEESTGWIGPYPSGQEVTECHSWDEPDTYTVSVKAKNSYKKSEESAMSITVNPRLPNLDCDTNKITLEQTTPGSVIEKVIKIENVGDPLSLLNWEIIDECPECGTWQFEPQSGNNLKPEDGKITINVRCTVPSSPSQSCGCQIRLSNKNNDNDYHIIEVDVETRAWVPELTVEGDIIINEKVTPGSSHSGSFTVDNTGETDSLLDWEVISWPSWGGSWNFNPISSSAAGYSLAEDSDPITVNVSFTAPEKRNEDFSGKITVKNLFNGNTKKINVQLSTKLSKSESSKKTSHINHINIGIIILEILNQYNNKNLASYILSLMNEIRDLILNKLNFTEI